MAGAFPDLLSRLADAKGSHTTLTDVDEHMGK